ncbi:MAG: cohesin domain-containing protein, partial [Clostridiaceae bacterium]
GLTFHEDGLLWGAVDGIIFAMDPDTYQVVKYKNIYPEIVDRGMWRPVHILFGEDGLLYTDVAGKLTVMKPDTLEHVTLIGSGPEVDFIALAKDSAGNENIYYIDASPTTLKMIPVIEGGVLEEPPAEEKEINVPIYNNSFEEPLKGNAIPGWSSLFSNITANVSFGITSDRSKSGDNSLRIIDKAQNETVFVQSDYISVVPGIEYTASTDLFLEDGSVSFFLRYFDKNGKQVGGDKDGVNIIHVRSGHKEWQRVRATVKAPEGAVYARLFAGASNYFTTSSAYFDDFKLSYKGFSSAPASPGTLHLSGSESVYEGEEFSVAINYFASETKDLKGINTSVTFDATKLQLIAVEKAGDFDNATADLNYELSSGKVNITVSETSDKVISESGDIINLRFKALENLGETNISMSKDTVLYKGDTSEEYAIGMERQLKLSILEAYAAIAEIKAKVTYDRGPVQDNEYTFILKNDKGEVIDTKGNIGEDITFDSMSFKEEGVYTYTLTQQPRSNNKIKIDRSIYTINVTVTRVREGYEAE